jgi:kinetochore protein Nuf2
MNTTREVVAPAMRAAAEEMCGDGAERLFTSDTRDLMAFFVILRKLLREVYIWTWTAPIALKLTAHSVVSKTSRSRTSTNPHTTD